MKVLFDGMGEIAGMSVTTDKKTKECVLRLDALGYRITIPGTYIEMSKDPDSDGLMANINFQDLISVDILIEGGDIRSMKNLMNKSVLGFMVKALM